MFKSLTSSGVRSANIEVGTKSELSLSVEVC